MPQSKTYFSLPDDFQNRNLRQINNSGLILYFLHTLLSIETLSQNVRHFPTNVMELLNCGTKKPASILTRGLVFFVSESVLV